MSRTSEVQRTLLDAAEKLFATNGLAGTSDRRIAVEAGQANNSAVKYHFGGREGLIRALLVRHLTDVEARRRELFENSHSLLDDVRSLVLPVTEHLAGLPVPSWRARFTHLVTSEPTITAPLYEMSEIAVAATAIVHSIEARLADIDPVTARARASLMIRLIAATCAEVETRQEQGSPAPTWSWVGGFLCDAITGMLLAPVTNTDP